jgi:hypothetical protein
VFRAKQSCNIFARKTDKPLTHFQSTNRFIKLVASHILKENQYEKSNMSTSVLVKVMSRQSFCGASYQMYSATLGREAPMYFVRQKSPFSTECVAAARVRSILETFRQQQYVGDVLAPLILDIFFACYWTLILFTNSS